MLTKSEKLPSGITIEHPLCKLPKDSGENRCNGKGKGVKVDERKIPKIF